MRIQNEGAGKSSWWVINPDAKPGRNPRRQRAATMESATKVIIDLLICRSFFVIFLLLCDFLHI